MGILKFIISGVMALVILSSCASERKVTYSKGASETGLSQYESDVKFVKAADGSVKPNKDKRSQFDGRSEYLGNRDFKGKDYTAKDYRKQRWGGNKDFRGGEYGGNTDGSRFQHSPEFVQQQARAQGQVAGLSGQQYGTNAYAVNGAREGAGAKRLARPSDAKVDSRRGVFKQPVVIDKADYSKMSIEESKRLLGR